MRIDILTACPELLESPLNHSIVQRAKDKGLLGEGKYQIAFNYIDKTEQPYSVIEKAMRKALGRVGSVECKV